MRWREVRGGFNGLCGAGLKIERKKQLEREGGVAERMPCCLVVKAQWPQREARATLNLVMRSLGAKFSRIQVKHVLNLETRALFHPMPCSLRRPDTAIPRITPFSINEHVIQRLTTLNCGWGDFALQTPSKTHAPDERGDSLIVKS